MSPKGMKCLRVLYALRFLIGQSGAGLTCMAQYAGCARSTVLHQMKKAETMGIVKVEEVDYREGFARRYHLTEAGIKLLDIPF